MNTGKSKRGRAVASALGAACLVSVVAAGPAGAGPNRSGASQTAATSVSGVVLDAQGTVVGGWRSLDIPAGASGPLAATVADSSGRENVGSGVWTYGVYFDSANRKHCWSKYYNIYYYHSATAQMNTSLKIYAWQFEYADAHLTVSGAFAQTCKVFWGVYP